MLKCYRDEVEHIVAESQEDASAIQAANIGEEASSPEQFCEVSIEDVMTIGTDNPDEFGGKTIETKTIREWIEFNGRGVLCSTEW